MTALKRKPRLGFLGVGWIGRARMQAVQESGFAEICGFADQSPEARAASQAVVPEAVSCTTLPELLAQDLDGLVIATPSAQHAGEALQALERGCAVFCQKPLGRHAAEARRVLEAAERTGRPFGVDFCYRRTAAMERIKEVVARGELGHVYAGRLVFHNAYGPDKTWYYDRSLSGGGCAMDLGIHLLDAALWMFEFPAIQRVQSRLYAQGRRLALPASENEDYALAQIDLDGGLSVDIACSWNLPAGADCIIRMELYGTQGGAVFENVGGSFYDFRADLLRKTLRSELAGPPDAWGGRTVVAWARELAEGKGFDLAARRYLDSALALDRVYAGE